MKKITVIGGGGSALMMAADLTLRGHQVTLCDQHTHSVKLRQVQEAGGISMTGNQGEGVATIHRVTFDAREAIAGAELILISAVVKRHTELIDWIVPHLENGQTICFSAGNCSSIELKRKTAGKNLLIGEMQGNIYPCRSVGPAKVISAFAYKEKCVSAFPANDNAAFVASLSAAYPCRAVKNVFEATLNSPNVTIHLPATLLGVSKMETMEDFRLYRDGLSPAVETMVRAVEDEKAEIMTAMGYQTLRAADQIHALLHYEQHPELEIFRGLSGPSGISDRYITEDAHAGNSLLLSLANATQTPAPLTAGLIAIASALNRTDFYASGVTLENLGLLGCSPAEINHYLETGELTGS